MKREKGAILLYVTIVCLFLLIVGITAYIGGSNKQAAQIAQLKQIEESFQTNELQEEDLYKQYEGGDIVPVYTPEQFKKVGSGEEVYVAEEGKIYTFSTDKTYMFYGIAEDLTFKLKEEIKKQIGNKNQEPCAPVLGNNMVAVYWSKDNGQTASINEKNAIPIYSKIDAEGNPSSKGNMNPNFKEENWYDYVAGYNLVDAKNSRWANAVTDDGSYWVWIPRFKYKIVNKPYDYNTYSAGTVDVKFISLEETSGVTLNGSTYVTTKNSDGEFITQDEEGYIIHPAFENGSNNGAKAKNKNDYIEFNNGEWDNELPGFWISKYEMSGENEEGTTIYPGDVLISDTVKMVSKRIDTNNIEEFSWFMISSGNAYSNCYNYDRKNESHLIKMSEWGAVAFLAHSQYGRNGNEVSYEISGNGTDGD